ncbi:MAG: AAA family ATPase [Nitrospirae bacterium]|nr:AAA family ATPase [Nitrospirota bacterium]
MDNGRDREKRCEIWAIGGGKGGTGKSFITSCIGDYLASEGKKVILIDADLGGANLHTFFGVSKPQNSLTDFFERKLSLNDIVIDCGIPDLGLVTGALGSLDSENIKHVQKLKFFKHIKSLDAEYVIIDLGAGSHGNTMDTFMLADKMIVVIVPELTSIENMYHFVKNVFFRKLKIVLDRHGLKDLFLETWKNRESHGIKNLNDLVSHLKEGSVDVRSIFDKEMSGFRIDIVLNQLRSSRDIMLGLSVKSVCMKFLGFHARYAGYVEHEESVLKCINKRQPFMRTYPYSNVVKEIGRLSDNLIEGKEVKTSEFVCRRL